MEDLILLVEDDQEYGKTLKDFFVSNSLSVIWSKDGEDAIKQFKESRPRLVVLDVALPYKDGFEVALEIRKLNSVVPLLFMIGTVLDTKNKIRAYRELRAINYLEKPVLPAVALAQIQSLLYPAGQQKFTGKDLNITIQGQQLIINSKEFQIREKEAQVFSLLLMNANLQVPRQHIIAKYWQNGKLAEANNALDSAISRIRKILKDFSGIKIKTTYGGGYRLIIK